MKDSTFADSVLKIDRFYSMYFAHMFIYLSDDLSTISDRQTLQLLFRTLHASFYLSCECLAIKSSGIPDAVMTK